MNMLSTEQACEQLSQIGERICTLRSAMERVSVDLSERQRLKLKSNNDSISIKDLLRWLEYFATE